MRRRQVAPLRPPPRAHEEAAPSVRSRGLAHRPAQDLRHHRPRAPRAHEEAAPSRAPPQPPTPPAQAPSQRPTPQRSPQQLPTPRHPQQQPTPRHHLPDTRTAETTHTGRNHTEAPTAPTANAATPPEPRNGGDHHNRMAPARPAPPVSAMASSRAMRSSACPWPPRATHAAARRYYQPQRPQPHGRTHRTPDTAAAAEAVQCNATSTDPAARIICPHVATCGHVWLHVVTCGCMWLHVATRGYMWLRAALPRNQGPAWDTARARSVRAAVQLASRAAFQPQCGLRRPIAAAVAALIAATVHVPVVPLRGAAALVATEDHRDHGEIKGRRECRGETTGRPWWCHGVRAWRGNGGRPRGDHGGHHGETTGCGDGPGRNHDSYH